MFTYVQSMHKKLLGRNEGSGFSDVVTVVAKSLTQIFRQKRLLS